MENQAAKQNSLDTTDDWRSQISAENEAKVQAMTEDEREAERQEILKAFGPSVGEILRRARDKREGKKEGQYIALEEGSFIDHKEYSLIQTHFFRQFRLLQNANRHLHP